MKELPILESIYRQYKSQGLVVLAVNAIEQDDLDKVEDEVNRLGMTFPVLLDHGDQFSKNYQAVFFPTTYFLDARGVIRQIKLGDSTEDKIRDTVEFLLEGGS